MVRWSALALTLATGFAGLVYEVVWHKYLATLLGSQGEATAAVLAIFLGGLAAGYALFGRATRLAVESARERGRAPRLFALYAWVEGGIGAYALSFPILFDAAQRLSLLGPIESDAFAFGFDVALAALLIGPPSVLMGGTIPILTIALARDLEQSTRVHAWVYGSNTLGAFAGALAGGYWLVPRLGLDGVMRTVGCLNLLAAAVFALLQRRAAPPAPASALPDTAAASRVRGLAAWSAVALLAGFAMMALQTTLNRVGALVLGSSQFTFAMVVAVFVLSIALGSFAVSALRSIPRSLVVWSQCALVAALFALYFALDDAGYWAHWIRAELGGMDARFADYQLAVFGSTLALLALPIGLSGALLPLLFHALRGDARDLGAVAGRLYAWNTLGSLLGALLGGYLLLIWLDLHHVYRIALACVAVGAWMLSALVPSRMPRAAAALALLLVLAATALLPAWHADRVTPGTFRARRPDPRAFDGADAFFAGWSHADVVFYDDDPTSSVAVSAPFRRPQNLALFVNGKPEGALEGDYPTMSLTALIPAWLAEHHARCFVVGLGTGVTAGELAALDATRRVTVAEISRGVIAASPMFSAGNLGAIENPKLEVVRGDAYRTLLRSPGRYDLIVSEPSNPWVAGVEMLYAVEFLEAVRERLEPGGVFAQWFHGYESSQEVVELIIRNYASVFRESAIWFTASTDLLLLGMQRELPSLDLRALEARFEQPDFRAAFARAGIASLPQLLAHELVPFGTLRAEDVAGPLHSLRRPILSDLAARAFFAGRRAVIGPFASDTQRRAALENSLLRRHAGGVAQLPDESFEVAAAEICARRRDQECATVIARWALDHPDSERLRAALVSLRKSAQRRNSPLAPQRLERVKELFDGEPARDGDSAIDSLDAQRTTERFAHLYHHVFPFEIGALERVWQRCGGAECAAGRARAAERVAALGERVAR